MNGMPQTRLPAVYKNHLPSSSAMGSESHAGFLSGLKSVCAVEKYVLTPMYSPHS